MDFIDEFIEEYKNNPCLWKADSANFKNRTKRQEAYLKLIEVAARHGEHYNVERTKQKINNLRCAFRHQLKKYTEFKSKSEKDELYCPKRRYFESLMFLKDEENQAKTSKRTNNARTSQKADLTENSDDKIAYTLIKDSSKADESNYEGDQLVTDEKSESVKENYICALDYGEKNVQIAADSTELNARILNDELTSQLCDFDKDCQSQLKKPIICRKRSSSLSSHVTNENDSESGVPSKTLKVNFTQSEIEKLLTIACGNIHAATEDHYSNFGKVIAHKLRTMDATQAIYAEKVIGDVLFHGQMKLLTSFTVNRFINTDHSNCEKSDTK